tara:strand:+ start:1016 stop:1846 length:831 start_codon:yes stop_codon:yes gene_type:complete
MSVVVKELMDSSSVSYSNGSYRKATREFLVYESSDNALDVSDVLANPDIPDVGYMGVQGEFHPSLPDLTAQEASIAQLSDKTNAYRVTITYNRIRIWGPDNNMPGYMELTTSTSAEFREVWRLNPDIGRIDNPIDVDIAGTAIDVKGEPVSRSFSQTTLQIQHVIEGNFPLSFLTSMAGKRNASVWGPFPAGTILYEGTDGATLGIGRRRLTHTFHYDSNYHLRQVSVPDFASGTAINAGSETAYALAAYPVFFRQPFPETAEFTLFGVDEVLVIE